MSRTRIKICGIRDADSAVAAASSGADAIGLVFVAGSPREVTIAQAREVVDALPGLVEPIGLFVDASAEQVRRVCAEVGLRTVQLHGKETPQFAAGLAPLRVIKSFALQTGSSVTEQLGPWSGPRNFTAMLWDAPAPGPGGGELPGGGGRVFDWNELAAVQKVGGLPAWAPLILAGGLHAGNVRQAIALLSPYAVDVSSGVESQRGVKDVAKIAAFCEAVRAADAVREK